MALTHYYSTAPSLPAAATFTAIFSILSVVCAWQLFRARTWFWLPFLVGGTFEIAGFAARSVNAAQQPYHWTFAPFVVQTLGLLLAPVLFASSMYMTLGRISELANSPGKLIVRRTWLTKIFVCSDILSFGIQVVGGVMITQQNQTSIDRGRKIVLVGLWLQIIFFSFFIINAIVLYWRVKKASHQPGTKATPWEKHLITLLIGCGLIMGRCIYRVIDYIQGAGGYLMTHEVWMYVFDSGFMVILMVMYNIIHPSEIMAWLVGGKMAVYFKVVSVEKSETYLKTHETGIALDSEA